MSFRNRCQIAGAAGIINLSVPLLKGRDQKTFMKDVRISDRQPWAAQHWKTIVSCYSRSPWFEYYRDELEGIYRRRFGFLLDWDMECLTWSLGALGMEVPVGLTERWEKSYAGDDGVVDWRGRILPKDLAAGGVGGEGTGRVMSGDGIDPGPGAWAAGADQPVVYRQVFEERTGFIPNLSILDLLFCEGKNAIRYIRSS